VTQLFIGTQGFAFKDWVGPFFPSGTPSSRYLEWYSRQFRTVEIDSTFYGVPRAATVTGWRRRTPDGFRVTAKFPQAITHQKMLVECEALTSHFIETMRGLGDKLGPLLLQFSYEFGPDRYDILARYLAQLPTDLQFAVEVRNRDWYDTEICDMLKMRGMALTLQDLYYMPRREDVTADFVYIRWLGRRADLKRFDHVQLDRRDEEIWWTERVQRFLEKGLTVYGYFNNHWAGHSPASAQGFLERLGQPIEPLEPPPLEPHQPRLL
jgi:uncharacterized protein YecE (DUF72 family)